MQLENAIVVLATAWGSKYGGINSFSTKMCSVLPSILPDVQIVCVCSSATEDDIIDAEALGVRVINLNFGSSPIDASWSTPIISIVRDSLKMNIIWWLAHDVITGELALSCKSGCGGQVAIFMHMSYDDYSYIKHDSSSTLSTSMKVAQQKAVFKKADKLFAVGPLLFDRMKELTNGKKEIKMVVPGLTTFIEQTQKTDRISALSFGRYERSESVTKQGPLAVVGFARAVKFGHEGFLKPLQHADLTIIGVEDDFVNNVKTLANEAAGRLVNVKVFPYIEDQEELSNLIEDCNVCLMLSWHEGFGLTAWEAIGAGIPVIISKNSGVYRLLESIGGAALGCINYVDVKGAPNGIPNEADIDEVARKLSIISADIQNALSNAMSLRTLLRGYEYTWESCARAIAQYLGLNLSESLSANNGTANVLEGFELSQANRLLESAKNNFSLGAYHNALGILSELRKQFAEVLANSYPLRLDTKLLEGEIHLRQNNYGLARAISLQIANLTAEGQDWPRYIKAKFIENTILRDQGKYPTAIKFAREVTSIAENKVSDRQLLEAAYRKLSRTLALGGNWQEALEYAQKAAAMAGDRGMKNGECTSSLAIAEAYRHGLDFETAKSWYVTSRDQAAHIGHTDCYIWAVLGLTDTLFLMNENPRETLQTIESFIEKNSETYPIEGLHVKLSLVTLDMKYNELKTIPTEITQNYERLGIYWPSKYLADVLKGDYSQPKTF